MNEKYKMIIASDSCNGEEKEFEAWMNEAYPEIETSIENVMHGGLYNEENERVDEQYELGVRFWDKYCSA